MRITDDTNAKSSVGELDKLDAMLQVGNEFMTHADESSVIQRSGPFVRIDMTDETEATRFFFLHETSDVYSIEGQRLDDAGYYALDPDADHYKRTRLYLSHRDTDAGMDMAFRSVGGKLDLVRMPRFTQGSPAPFPRRLYGMHERAYTAIAGKRRLFPQPDAKVLVVRDVVERGGRYFYGGSKTSMSRVRSARVSRVEVVPVNPETGRVGAPIFGFPVFSGLGVDITGIALSNSPTSDAGLPVIDGPVFRSSTAGACWGSDLHLSTSNMVPQGGDAGDLYAVCEPARLVEQGSDGWLSLIAVYAGDDDVHSSVSSGPFRLTCKRTTPDGAAVTSKINFQSIATNHYLSACGMTLLRTGPNTVMLRVFVIPMQSGVPGSLQSDVGSVLYFWTVNNGESWTYQPIVGGFPVNQTYGGLLVRDETTVLAFESEPALPTGALSVWSISPSGFNPVGSIPAATLNAGLMQSPIYVPYLAFGFGGVMYRQTDEGPKKRLWMQFDPRWGYEKGMEYVLEYPGSRPLLMVSDDGGVTWSRRFLPVPWAFRVGFVVSVDGSTLAVPVYSERVVDGLPLRVAVHLSRDGGETWKASSVTVKLPGETRVDGGIVMGEQIGSGAYQRMSQDIADCWLEYNRGELHPMLVLRNARGELQTSNPARPWMVDTRKEAPDYA